MKRYLQLLVLLLLPFMAEAQYRNITSHIWSSSSVPSALSLQGNRTHYFMGDTLVWEFGGLRYKMLMKGGSDGSLMTYDSLNRFWRPVAGGGGGGATTLNGLSNQNGNGSLSLGTYYQWFSSGNTASNNPTWKFEGAGDAHSGYLVQINTSDASSSTKPIGIFARGTSNGVMMTSLGAFTYLGTGTINANLWKGSATFDKASQHASTVYKDQANTFTVNQTITVTGTSPGLNVASTGSANGINGTASGAAYYGVLGNHTAAGIGVAGTSGSGYGGYFYAETGPPLLLGYNGANRLVFHGTKMLPWTAHTYALGDTTYPLSQVHADSVFVNGVKWAPAKSGKAYFDAAGQVYVSGLGTDSTWAVQVTLGGDPGQPITYYAELTESGELFVYSLTSEVEGIPVYYTITLRTDL